MKYRLKQFTPLLLFVFFMACKPVSIEKDMVYFDQAFIPVLVYLHQDQPRLAESAAFQLEAEWEGFHKKYKDKLQSNEDWTEAFRQADSWLEGAVTFIQDNDPANALGQLDHMRYELMEARRIGKIDYYLDYVWDVEEVLLKLVDIAHDPMLNLIEFEEFECMTNELEINWSRVTMTEPDGSLFELFPDKAERFRNAQWQLNTRIAQFREAVDCGDGEQFDFLASNLKTAYLDFITVFGQFEMDKDETAM